MKGTIMRYTVELRKAEVRDGIAPAAKRQKTTTPNGMALQALANLGTAVSMLTECMNAPPLQ
eukprot:3706172-Rhodomonas_salina.1